MSPRCIVDEGGDLPEAMLCGVSPDTTGYNDALELKSRWNTDTYTDKSDKRNLTELQWPTKVVHKERL